MPYSDAPRGSAPRRWVAVAVLAIVFAASAAGANGQGNTRDTTRSVKSAGLLVSGRDGGLLTASAARIGRKAGAIDKAGSLVVGLGGSAPDYQSAALSLARLVPRGALDVGFGTNGAVVTPLAPLDNRDSVTVTALLADGSGRSIVAGWRTQSTALDANFKVIVAARYTADGSLDPSYGERGIVTTRIGRDDVTQGFAAALDGEGRLLIAGYNGGRNRNAGKTLDDWPVRVVLLRYTVDGALDPSFGTGGVASRVLVSGRPNEKTGRDFLYYDYGRIKAAGLLVDRQGRAVVAAARDEGPIVLMRYTAQGAPDPGFGSAGSVETPVGKRTAVASLIRDAQGRLIAAGTSDNAAVLLRYSADGVLDASFGDGGIRRTPIGEDLRVSAALQEGSGHLLVVASGNKRVQLSRYDADGRADRGFGSNGVVMAELDRIVATRAGLAVDDAGAPVVTVAGDGGMFYLRFARAGPVDKTFLAIPNTVR